MVNFEMEQRHLAQSQRHLREGRGRVRQQIKMVRALRADGQDPSLAIQLLVALRDAVAVGRQHKALIEAALRDQVAY